MPSISAGRVSPAGQAASAWLHSSKKVRPRSVIIIQKVQDFPLQFAGSWSQHNRRGQHWQEGVHSMTQYMRNNALCLFFICDKYFYYLYPVKIWVFFLLDFYNLILPFRKRISKNSAEQIRITRNSSLHWIVKRNTWMQHRPKMSSFSKRTRTFIKGKRYFPDYHSWKIYLIWFRVSGKSLFYENFSFKSDPNEFETRRRKTEERKLLRALVNDFTNTIV